MINRVLIANRGEIALRILRACRTMGIEAVVAYSEADRTSLPALLADEAICIGPADAKRSYLSAPAIISAAMVTGCDAIHPGYGFLSEDDAFADAVRAHGLTFIGPSAPVLERFASKEETRRLLAAYGLPTIPGSGLLADEQQALDEAERIGYPVLIKPSAGGGGKGMRMVRSPRELAAVLPICRSEAKAAFGDDALYLEKWLEDNRHVEIQVAVDRFGVRRAPVGARLLRPAPAPEDPRGVAVPGDDPDRAPGARRTRPRAVVAAGYENMGTLEFLVDAEGNAYFIEINCRIQVEHPVTEMLTGIDLVALQIRIAAGEPLGLTQADIPQRGHAIEFRINAEDALHDFRPGRRDHRALQRAGRARGPLRLPRLRRLRGPAVLRLAPGQARGLGPHPRGRHRPRPGRPRRARHRGRRHQHRDPPGAARVRAVPRGPVHHQPARPDRQRRVPRGRGACLVTPAHPSHRPCWSLP